MWRWIRYSLLAIAVVVVFLFGVGGKTEFSPDTVQMRHSVFWGSPDFSIPTHVYSTPGLDYARERLRDAKPIYDPPRWWLVHESGAGIACGIGPGQMGSRISSLAQMTMSNGRVSILIWLINSGRAGVE